jgi:hypothetical protein
MFDNAELQALFVTYQATRSNEDLVPLWQAMTRACRTITRARTRKLGVMLTPFRILEISTDAANRYVDFLLRHPENRKVIRVAKRLKNEVLYQLHGPSAVKSDRELLIDDDQHQELNAPDRNPFEYIQAILADTRLDGRRIIYHLFSRKYYSQAIKRIGVYTSVALIVEYAVHFHTIFEHTRRTWERKPRTKVAVIRSGSLTTHSPSSHGSAKSTILVSTRRLSSHSLSTSSS